MIVKYFVKANVNEKTVWDSVFLSSSFHTTRQFDDWANVEAYINKFPKIDFEITKVTYEPVEYKRDPLYELSKDELISRVRALEEPKEWNSDAIKKTG